MLADRITWTPLLDLVGNEFSKVGPRASDGSCRSTCSNLSFRGTQVLNRAHWRIQGGAHESPRLDLCTPTGGCAVCDAIRRPGGRFREISRPSGSMGSSLRQPE